jgi:phosphatidylserine/phosphatidylglycerophosphate/cardiolipin synthase-like enzyme
VKIRWVRVVVAFVLCTFLLGCSAKAEVQTHPLVVPTPPPGSLSVLVEPEQGVTPIYALLGSAKRSIDLTMYELVDPQAEQALEQAARRGVAVRVILDGNREKAANKPAYGELAAHGVQVVWADPRYAATHEKAVVVDDAVAAVMSLNLTARYYPDTRDFAVLDRQPADVQAIEAVFDADFKHHKVEAAPGDDLVWSPGAEGVLLSLIDSATSTLLVENEEMALPAVTAALERAAGRGAHVTVAMTRQDDWAPDFDRLAKSRVDVRTYAPTARLYIHAKAIVVDDGTPRAKAFIGSQNFSSASLSHNRELGLLTADPEMVDALAKSIRADAASASRWKS